MPDWLLTEPTSAAVVRLITRQNAIDPRLMPTDRHMQRWASGQGSGLANPDVALLERRARLDPLPMDQMVATDRIVLRSPDFVHRFTDEWYRYCWDTERIGRRLGGNKERVLRERDVVLGYLLGCLMSCGIRVGTWEARA